MQSPAHHSTLQSQPHLPLHPSFSEPAFSQPYSRVDNPHASSARGLHRRPKSDAHDEVHSQRSEPHLQHEVTQSYVLGGDNQFGDDPVEYHERSSFEYEPGPEEAADAYSHGATHDHLRRRDDEQPSAPRVSVARTTDRVMDAMRSHARALDTGYSNLNSAVARSAVSQIPLQALSVTEPLDLFRALLNAPAPSCAPPIVGHALSSSLGTALGLRVAARANMAVLHGVHAESHEVAMTPRDFARAKVPVACALAAARLHPHSPAAPHFVMSRSGVDSSEDLAAEDAVVQHAHRKFVSALQNRLPLGGAGAAAPVRSMASDAQVVPSVRRHKARTLRQPSRRK